MRVSEEPVCIELFRQNPVFTSLHLRSPDLVGPPIWIKIHRPKWSGSKNLVFSLLPGKAVKLISPPWILDVPWAAHCARRRAPDGGAAAPASPPLLPGSPGGDERPAPEPRGAARQPQLPPWPPPGSVGDPWPFWCGSVPVLLTFRHWLSRCYNVGIGGTANPLRRIYTDSHTHEHLQMLEIPCTKVVGQLDGRTRATFTSCMYILHKGETMGKTRATYTSYVPVSIKYVHPAQC